MSGYWWFDAFAYIGMGCVTGAVMCTVYMFVSEFRARRKFTREMREFDRQMGALVRAWEKSE
jgi:hypothetical protein